MLTVYLTDRFAHREHCPIACLIHRLQSIRWQCDGVEILVVLANQYGDLLVGEDTSKIAVLAGHQWNIVMLARLPT